MRQRWFSAIVAGALLASPAAAAEVAILKSSDAAPWRPAIDALKRVAVGHTITEFDLRGDRAEGERVLGGLKGRGVVLVALGPLAAQLAREQMPEAPLVYAMVQDPARLGLDVPGVAGVAFSIPVKNQLAAFRMVNPRAVRIGVLYTEENLGRLIQDAVKAAGIIRVALIAKPVASEREVPVVLRSLLSGPDAVDALYIAPDPALLGDEARRHVLSEALKAGKPVYSFSAALVPEGALASNGPDFASIGEQAGDLVNRLAGGEKGKIEMLIPRAELIINKKVADRLKVDIPADAIKAAARVF